MFKNGIVKIGDLNVSIVKKQALASTWTGTPFYASPEIWKSKPYDEKSDMWSLGVCFYELATLRVPFDSDNMDTLSKIVLKGKYEQVPSWFSRDLSELLSSLLQLNP